MTRRPDSPVGEPPPGFDEWGPLRRIWRELVPLQRAHLGHLIYIGHGSDVLPCEVVVGEQNIADAIGCTIRHLHTLKNRKQCPVYSTPAGAVRWVAALCQLREWATIYRPLCLLAKGNLRVHDHAAIPGSIARKDE